MPTGPDQSRPAKRADSRSRVSVLRHYRQLSCSIEVLSDSARGLAKVARPSLSARKDDLDRSLIGCFAKILFQDHGWFTLYTQQNHDMRSRMRQSRKSGSVGGEGRQLPCSTRLSEISMPRNNCKNFFSPITRASSRNETYKDNKKTSQMWTAQKCGQIMESQLRSTVIRTL